ncbi:transporter substrate-binding domain-containing protein [Ferrimonas lipolytica]|uniref:Transporter substrate-binding domain-containing protein n=1 Tax=Ferrimonas lipolytica TaxID=2724191 RepID=A0A6H1UED8_9GAMM|nr:transporter substrate-binding domain-containing protein [Ferrimonas lipolytica]QIZ77455.1 transporter substrate-binding domain-containing protein [Ferrimonas lipolytica]
MQLRRLNQTVSTILLLGAMLLFSSLASAQTSFKVGSYNCPPFVIENDDGSFRGLSLLLWQQIAQRLQLEYEVSQHELEDLLEQVSNNNLQVGVSCISITPEREQLLDFSHSFYETHLAIAVKPRSVWSMVKNFLTNRTLWLVIGIVSLIACVVGFAYYRLERKVNDKLYSMPTKAGRGIEGFILGLLFITKGPFNYYEFKTLTARVITVLLAVFTTFFLASITAVLASTFTLGALTSDISGPNDLRGKRVGAKTESTASSYLQQRGIRHRTYDDLEGMMQALARGEIRAIVADDAILKYTLNHTDSEDQYSGISVLPYQFERQNYGLVLPENSPIREQLNQALLEVRTTSQWQQTLTEYLAQ